MRMEIAQKCRQSAAIAQAAAFCRRRGLFGVFADSVCPKSHRSRVDLGRGMHPEV
ncbi:hypothetical protein SAMN04488025_12321 [Planifilum fulgidum]|uniref:Uncharacterized protein n=1 Tax=Planifilum fulgidum TaxID=201973 RepID=A0A1I2QIT7_9BACL|nr:hypothetical protein [Planifilum fulgidum]SFG26107.1 hypothetical protein SAMN04488025_12321 [Planifilum fulgidum]